MHLERAARTGVFAAQRQLAALAVARIQRAQHGVARSAAVIRKPAQRAVGDARRRTQRQRPIVAKVPARIGRTAARMTLLAVALLAPRRADARSVAGPARVRAAQPVAAERSACGSTGRRTPREHMDESRDSLRIRDARVAAHDFDALDIVDRQGIQIDRAAARGQRIVLAHMVDQNDDMAGISAPQIQRAITAAARTAIDDDARLADLQDMLDDTGIDAILMGRGGYGVSRIIDMLDFTAFLKKPKWICGFSDITVLHQHIHAQYQVPTLHSPMCGAFKPETVNTDHIKNFYAALIGESLRYHTSPAQYNRTGMAEGILTGGNLAMLAHLTGSASEVNTDGKILFIEDIGEHLYNIDRLLLNLKRAGRLDHLKGLVVGSFTDLQDTERPFGQTIEEIIWDKVKEYNYPVCFNFPCGHQDINYTLTLGMTHKLIVNDQGGELLLLKQHIA